MQKRDLRPLVQLVATFVFGLSVLALLSILSFQMVNHYLEAVAERSVRQAFTEGTQSDDGVSYDTACQGAGLDPERFSECDPIAVKGERSFRSASCSGRGFLGLLGKHWTCIAKFADGSTLRLHASLGFGSRHLTIFLPSSKPDA